MPLNRVQLEQILVGVNKASGRCGKILVRVEQYVVADVTLGAIPALADPIAEGVAACGVVVTDPTAPTNAEITAAHDADSACLRDVAELRCLESARGNIDLPTASADNQKQHWGEYAAELQVRINQLTDRCADQHGYPASQLGSARMDLGFQSESS